MGTYFLASHPDEGVPIKRKRTQRSQNEIEKDILIYTERVKSGTIRITSDLANYVMYLWSIWYSYNYQLYSRDGERTLLAPDKKPMLTKMFPEKSSKDFFNLQTNN